MITAGIDIGSNTVRLLIADIKNKNINKIIFEDRKITRLAENLIDNGYLQDDAINRTVEVLKKFKKNIDIYKPEKIKTIATSAVREAKNSEIFLEKVSKIGLNVEVIDGESEGYYTYLGVNSILKINDKNTLIFDIGGGSTEFIYILNKQVEYIKSLSLGVVKLADIFRVDDKLDNNTKLDLIKYINPIINNLDQSLKPDMLVGTAGTITTIAAIDSNLKKYDRNLINNYKLKKDNIKNIFNHLASINSVERVKKYPLLKGREDLIIPGILIILSIMDYFNINILTVSDFGLREGLTIAAAMV
ncbi:MAG: hypothetical protein SVN78_00100 [Deferribacterota bacterium]|nr:hypothetical protein [Deferribacterota bacterium]